MIPRWLLVAISVVTIGVFVADYTAQFLVDGYESNPAIITTFGAVAGMVFMLARGDKGKPPDPPVPGGEQ